MSLFSKYLEYKKHSLFKLINDSQKKQTLFLDKSEAEDEGTFLFKNLKKSGFCTFYTGLSFWNINSRYFRESRKASRRTHDLTRVYILRDLKDLDNKYLQRQIELDLVSDTKVYLCNYKSIPSIEFKKDFGIWDESHLCIVGYDSNNVVTGITISGSKEDLERAKYWKKEILKVSEKIDSKQALKNYIHNTSTKESTHMADRYKEFQLQSIEYQMSVAEKECSYSHIDKGSCKWYHSSWPILRALNVVSTPNWHGNFYIKEVSRFMKDSKHKPNILISATADATIIEHLEAALGKLEKANIWVIDQCPTPLAVVREYAKLRGTKIHTLQIDALNLVQNGFRNNFFDIVMTDAFITRFNDKTKNKLLQSWYNVLVLGGIIITTCRITGKKKEIGTKQEVEQFVLNTSSVFDGYAKKNRAISKYINKDLTLIKSNEYATHIESNPIKEKDIYRAFIKTGFEIQNKPKMGYLTTKKVGGEFKPTTYAQIVAKK